AAATEPVQGPRGGQHAQGCVRARGGQEHGRGRGAGRADGGQHDGGDLDEPEEVVRPPGVGLHLRRCALAPPPAARPAHAPPAPLPPLGAVDQRRGSQRNHRRTANTDSAVQATAVTRAVSESDADRSPLQPPRTRVTTGVSGSSSQNVAIRSGSTSRGTVMPEPSIETISIGIGVTWALSVVRVYAAVTAPRATQITSPNSRPATIRCGADGADMSSSRAQPVISSRLCRSPVAAAGRADPARISASRSSPV